MNKISYTAAVIMAMTAASASAHHPAADIVDPDVYAMIDENVADTPHADMVLDAMGAAMDQAVVSQNGPQSSMSGVDVDIELAMDAANAVDTIDLMENVVDTLAR